MNKEDIIKNLKKYSPRDLLGGQCVSMVDVTVGIESKELNIKIEVKYYKSMLKNHELAYRTMLKIIDELVN